MDCGFGCRACTVVPCNPYLFLPNDKAACGVPLSIITNRCYNKPISNKRFSHVVLTHHINNSCNVMVQGPL